jgi:hypothetical protein
MLTKKAAPHVTAIDPRSLGPDRVKLLFDAPIMRFVWRSVLDEEGSLKNLWCSRDPVLYRVLRLLTSSSLPLPRHRLSVDLAAFCEHILTASENGEIRLFSDEWQVYNA